MYKGFWKKLETPIVGLSPMDGVTDASMRFVAKKYGLVDVIYTEFVSAEGLWRIKKRGEMEAKIWRDLLYDESERPVVAQLFGSDPESFYEAAKIVRELGFDGVDINMGCPSPGIEKRGGGAGLIRDKCNAKEVVEATRRGVAMAGENPIPVSVKTRIGSREPDRSWWQFLAEQELPAVAMHGRTFKQLYAGKSDWHVLSQAAQIIRESGALFLGNGDVARVLVGGSGDMSWGVELKTGERLNLSQVMDGVLVGREAIGNPWVLRKDGVTPSDDDKLTVAIEQSQIFEKAFPGVKFFPMRKHLGMYVKGFDGAGEVRRRMVLAEDSLEVAKVVSDLRKKITG